MRRRAISLGLGLFLLHVGAAATAAPDPETAGPVMSIGVSAFVNSDGEAREALAQSLARALSDHPGVRVVFPSQFKDLAVDDPEAREVRRWAERRKADVIVVGQQKLRGNEIKLDIEVRSGHSGAAVERYELAADDPEAAAQSVRKLAPRILRDLGIRPVEEEVAAGGNEVGDAKEEEGTKFDLGGKGKPVAIQSDELEVTQSSGARHIVFTGNVTVKQGTVTLAADRLDAYYAKGSSRPEYLEATGSVRVRDGNKKARCENAVYHNTDRMVLCKGKAELVQGCDRVRGSEIEFDLEAERVRVLGAASVVLQGEQKPKNCDGGFE